MKNKFGTCINCIDGRTHLPIIKYMKHKYNVEYLDLITEPGVNKILSDYEDKSLIDSIKNKVEISLNSHNSKIIVVGGHYDCAANDADEDEQINQIKKSIQNIKSWSYGIKAVGVYVDNKWKVHEVKMDK